METTLFEGQKRPLQGHQYRYYKDFALT